jgi:hypothetical protein
MGVPLNACDIVDPNHERDHLVSDGINAAGGHVDRNSDAYRDGQIAFTVGSLAAGAPGLIRSAPTLIKAGVSLAKAAPNLVREGVQLFKGTEDMESAAALTRQIGEGEGGAAPVAESGSEIKPSVPGARPSTSPNYTVAYETDLPTTANPGHSEQFHFSQANRNLYSDLKSDPDFAAQMESQYPGITEGVTPGPRGRFPRSSPTKTLTWHHEPNRPGVLQLVPRAEHQAPGPIQSSLHPGGRGGMENWGGGYV